MRAGSPQGSILANFLFWVTTDQFGECADEVNYENDTVSFNENGADLSSYEENGFVPLSPITRPVIEDLTLSSSSEEDEIRASQFIYFNPVLRINDTELSILPSQDEIHTVFGKPPGWEEIPVEIKVYIDDLNAVEKICPVNAVSLISENERKL